MTKTMNSIACNPRQSRGFGFLKTKISTLKTNTNPTTWVRCLGDFPFIVIKNNSFKNNSLKVE